MLNGVSHDLRTILTRFKLSLALLGDEAEAEEHCQRHRRNAAHARSLSRLRARRQRRKGSRDRYSARCSKPASATPSGTAMDQVVYAGDPIATVRPDAFRRCLANLVGNALRHGRRDQPEGRATKNSSSSMSTTTDLASRRPARGRLPAVLPARRGAQPGQGRHGPRPRDRPRHRPRAWRRRLSDAQPLGGLRATVRVPV